MKGVSERKKPIQFEKKENEPSHLWPFCRPSTLTVLKWGEEEEEIHKKKKKHKTKYYCIQMHLRGSLCLLLFFFLFNLLLFDRLDTMNNCLFIGTLFLSCFFVTGLKVTSLSSQVCLL